MSDTSGRALEENVGRDAAPERLTVVLAQVGEAFGYSVDDLADELNSLAIRWLKFEPRIFPLEALDEYELSEALQIAHTPYWDAAKAMTILRENVPAPRGVFVIGITPGWLADDPAGAPIDVKDSYLGYWHNRFVPQPDWPAHAIISTALWQSHYERSSYRNVRQYIVHMIVAALGDYLVETVEAPNEDWPGLTHAVYQNCTFDYTPNLDSIVTAVQRSRICERCQRRLKNPAARLRVRVPAERIDTDLDYMLGLARVPPTDQVFRALQEDPRFSFIAFGFLLSLFVGLVGDSLAKSPPFGILVSVLCFVVLLGIWFLKRRFLTGRPMM